MAFEPSMDLDSRKKQKELRQKKDGGQTKYGFGISKEVRKFKEEKSQEFQRSMDLNYIEK